MPTFAIRGTFCHALSPTEIEVLNDALVVVEDGIIKRISRKPDAEERMPQCPVLRLSPAEVCLPGFVDTHVHPAQAVFAGGGTDRPLLGPTGWLETCTYPAERSWADPAVASEVASEFVQRALRHGTTAAIYFGTIHREGTLQLVDACLAHGQRAVCGKVAMDRCSPADYVETTEQSIGETEAFIQSTLAKAAAHPSSRHPNGPLVFPAITPRFIPTCSPAAMKGLGDLAKRYEASGVFVQSHIAQSADELAFVEKLHPGQKDAALFDEAGLLTSRCVLAHGVHLSSNELNLLALRGSSIAFCPLSNVFHTESPSSTLDAAKARAHGCKVGLCTDVAGGYSHSMLSACRTA